MDIETHKKTIHEWQNGTLVESVVEMTPDEIAEQQTESTVIIIGESQNE